MPSQLLRRVVLTDKKVAALRPPAKGRVDVYDALMPRLCVRLTENGAKTFMMRCRFPGYKHAARRALGVCGSMTVEQARRKAGEWHILLEQGTDPTVWDKQQKEALRLAALRAKTDTFLSVAEAYFAHVRAEGLVKASVIEREIRHPKFGFWHLAPRNIHDITQTDIAAVINAAKARGAKAQAFTLLERARSLFRWARGTGAYGLTSLPTTDLIAKDLIGSKRIRQRHLSDEELRALWRAAGKEAYPWGPLYKMLVLTGARLSDISDASWSEIDLDQKLFIIPPERFKSDVPHTIPLAAEMLAILEALPRFKSGDFVFSANWGRSAVAGFSKPKQRIDRRMLLTLRALARVRYAPPPGWLLPFVNHDIRRTMRSHLSALPIEEHLRELMIGHGRKGIQRVYDRYRYEAELRHGFELWSKRLSGIVNPTPANVTKIGSRRRK